MDRRERRHLPLIKVVLEGEQRELNDPGQRLCRFLPGDYYLARSDTERDPQRVLGEAIALTPRGVRATIASSAPILGVRCSGGKTISKRPQSVSGSAVGRGSRVVLTRGHQRQAEFLRLPQCRCPVTRPVRPARRAIART